MNATKYVAMDVHKSTTVISVINSDGHFEAQSVLKTSPQSISDFIKALSGTIHLTFEEGTHAQWLSELLRPLVAQLLVCNPRLSSWSKTSNKNDKLDSLKMASDLRAGLLKGVYHGPAISQTLKQLVHNYEAITSDTTRVMNRIKALYRSRAIDCSGRDVYYQRNRCQWLDKLKEPGLRMRAEFLFNQLDHLRPLRREACKAMIKEARRNSAFKPLCKIVGLGPVRVAQIIAAVETPFRFRSKRQFWTYCGFSVVTRSSSDYEIVGNRLLRKQKRVQTRGLNPNYNRRLKNVFKAAALEALKDETVSKIYRGLIERGTKPEMARLTIARKLAAVTLAIYKSREEYDGSKLTKELT